MSRVLFEIKNLSVSVEGKQIINDLSLIMKSGEVHAIMGRNGSGKTTLANTLMGHPSYEVHKGSVILDGEDITNLAPDERARKRLFLGFQYPVAVPGVSLGNFLRTSFNAVRNDEVPKAQVRKLIKAEATALQVSDEFLGRSLNEGLSGGEKKRVETLQLRLLQPKVAIMDETDSGLDIDALKLVADKINSLRSADRGILLITHYQRLLDYVRPDQIHVMIGGRFVKSGGPELAHELEAKGYDNYVEAHE